MSPSTPTSARRPEAEPVSVPTIDPANRRYHIAVATLPADLEARQVEWQRLAEEAVEPNVFYEPWFLLPAIEEFGSKAVFRFVWVTCSDISAPKRAPVVTGFFPLELRPRSWRVPLRRLALWRHLHCFLATPLLHRDHLAATLARFVEWFRHEQQEAPLLEMRTIHGEGPFQYGLLTALHQADVIYTATERYPRALLRRAADAETYLKGAISGRALKEVRRKTRRLAESGPVTFAEWSAGEDAKPWLAEFFALEAKGWKGCQGTALACQPTSQRFFTHVVEGAAQQQKLMLLALRLGNRDLAMKCNFLSGGGAFAFKIAFDEEFAHYSPGFMLEVENIRRCHDGRLLHWMDSCADQDHWMINRLWTERRMIESLLIGSGGWAAESYLSLLPFGKCLKRRLRRRREPHKEAGAQEP